MNLTDEQLLAVEENSIPICISAGAGSGKTRVLVEKFWRLLELGFEIDEILAVTFTRKAAREMIERIRQRVDLSDIEPAKKRSLKEGLNTAWIGTIDSICSRIIRDYPIEADIDPHFNIADDMTINQLRYEIAREIVLKKIEEEEVAVLEYIETFGYNQILDDMQTLITIMTSKGISLEKIEAVTWSSIDEVKNNLSKLVNDIEEVYESIIASIPNLSEKTKTYKKVAQMAEDKEMWLKIISNLGKLNYDDEDWAALQKLYDLGKGSIAKEVKEDFESLKDLIEELQGSIVDINNKRYLETLFNLTKEMHDQLIMVKAEKSLLEYFDLEDKTIHILKNYPEILSHFQNQFKHIMVDEFQDTNYRQVELISLISNDFNNCVFAVGDPKQSIYRFRGAQVNLFAETTERISQIGGLSHQLSNNFRTRSILIDFINSIFSRLMEDSKDFNFQPLVAARLGQGADHTELHLLKTDDDLSMDTDEAEAYLLAKRISQMVNNEEKLVYEKVGSKEVARSVNYSDIAILFQKSKTMNIFTSVLSEYNIPYYIVGSHGFFTTEEVNTVILALKVIDNFYDEFSWVGILRSAMFGVSDEALWLIKEKYNSIHDGIYNIEELINEIKSPDYDALLLGRNLISNIIANKSRLSLVEIIEKVIHESNYDLFLSCQLNGEQKLANIDKLIEMAKHDTIEAYDDIGEFLHYVEKAKNSSNGDEQQAVIDDEASNTVKLMTIHQSKGLEFPIVILPHIQQGFNFTDKTQKLIFSDNIGLFINTDPKGLLRRKAQDEEERLILEEYKRLFYVAQTRACDYLILSACYQEKKDLPTAPKNSWLNWIFDYYGVTDNSLSDYFAKDGIKTYLYDNNAIDLIREEIPIRTDQVNTINLSSYEYKMPASVDSNEYISATRLIDYEFCPFYAYLKHSRGFTVKYTTSDEFDEVKELDAVNIGNIIHKVIEETNTLSEAKDKLKSILAKSKSTISPEEMDLFHDLLTNYYEHDLIKNLSNSSEVLKEVPFLARLEDKVFLNGVIDQLWLDDEFYHVLDLKTGRSGNIYDESYHLQLNLYQLALDRILSQSLGRKGVFYLRNKEIQDIKDVNINFNLDYQPSPQETSRCKMCPNKGICFP